MESFTVSSPTRADLAGGTLDLWPLYCLVGGGKTLNIALDLCARVEFKVEKSDVFAIELNGPSSSQCSFFEAMSLEEIAELPPTLRFPATILSRFIAQKKELPALKATVTFESKVPMGSGLGGSSSLCVALVRGISRLTDDFIDQGWQWKVLDFCRDVEANFLKTPTGTQDYLAALFGGIRTYESSLGAIETEPFTEDVFRGMADRCLILFSGEQHQSGLSNWELYKKAIDGDAVILKGLNQLKQLASALDDELRSGNLNWPHIGKFLNEEWLIRKNLFGVTTPRLDEIQSYLQSQGVLGSKVCGAAQGGSLLVLVPPQKREIIAKACQSARIQVLPAQPTKRGVTMTSLK